MAHDVFISYATEDKAFAHAACAAIEAAGYRCWIAPRDVMPGVNYGKAIVEGIDGTRLTLLLLSSSSNRSSMVLREVELSASGGKAIVPCRVEDVEPGPDLRFFLAGAHWLDAIGGKLELHMPAVVEAVKGHLGERAAPKTESTGAGASGKEKREKVARGAGAGAGEERGEAADGVEQPKRGVLMRLALVFGRLKMSLALSIAVPMLVLASGAGLYLSQVVGRSPPMPEGYVRVGVVERAVAAGAASPMRPCGKEVEIVVENDCDRPTVGVEIEVPLPGDLFAEGDGWVAPAGRAGVVARRIEELGPREKRTLPLRVWADRAGSFTITPAVRAGDVLTEAKPAEVTFRLPRLVLGLDERLPGTVAVTVKNDGDGPARDIEVMVSLPPKVSFVSSAGSKFVGHGSSGAAWRFEELAPGAEVRGDLQLRSGEGGGFRLSARAVEMCGLEHPGGTAQVDFSVVAPRPASGARVDAGGGGGGAAPKDPEAKSEVELSVESTAAGSACDQVAVACVVKNKGSSEIAECELLLKLPAGVTLVGAPGTKVSSSGSVAMGSIKPGVSKRQVLLLRAGAEETSMVGVGFRTEREFVPQAREAPVRAAARPRVALEVSVPASLDVDGVGPVKLTVMNVGDVPARDVLVTLPAAAGLSYTTQGAASTMSAAGAQGRAGVLGPGEAKEFVVMVKRTSPMGIRVTACAAAVCAAEVSKPVEFGAVSAVRRPGLVGGGGAALEVSVKARAGKVEKGDNMVCDVTVKNNGGVAAENVEIEGKMSERVLSYASCSVPGVKAGKEEKVLFPVIASLGAGEEKKYTVTFRTLARGRGSFTVTAKAGEQGRGTSGSASVSIAE